MVTTRSSSKPSLPVELLSRVFSQVSSITTLKNIALCSSAFYDIAVPLLYCRIDLRNNDEPYQFKHLRPLTSLFLRNPKLASHVRYLTMRGAFDEHIDYRANQDSEECESPPLALDNDWQDKMRALTSTGKQAQDWIKAASWNDGEGAVISLMLCMLPRLETLDIELGIVPEVFKAFLLRVARREAPFDSTPVLASLKTITLFHTDEKYGGDLMAGASMLPAIERIFQHRVGTCTSEDSNDADAEMRSLPTAQSPLKHLELKNCRLGDEDLKAMLAVPKALETFIYELDWGHISYNLVGFPAYQQTLAKHRDSLRDLWLDYVQDGIDWLEGEDTTPLVLSGFQQLQRLRIATVFLLGQSSDPKSVKDIKRLAAALPHNLTSLRLTHCEDDTAILPHALHHLLNSGHFPNLRSLCLEIPRKGLTKLLDQHHGASLRGVLSLAASLDVKVTLLDNHEIGGNGDWKDRKERLWGMDEDIAWGECSSACNTRPVYEVLEVDKVVASE